MSKQATDRISLWQLSWPIGIELFFQFLMGTADTLMVSRIGDHAVSAVGISNQIIQSALTLFALINAGVSVVVARKWGAGRPDLARKTSVIALQANLAAGLVLSLFFLFGASSALLRMGTPEEVLPYAGTYLTVVGAGTVVVVLHGAINAVIRSIGNTRGPMYITFGMNVLHVLLNYALIFGELGFPEMGIAGAALSTMISRAAALAVTLWLLWRSFHPYWSREDWTTLERPLWREILSIGLPVSVTALSWGYSQMLMLGMVARMGPVSLASYTYVQTIQQFPWIFASAIAGGLGIRIAQLYGARRFQEMYAGFYRALAPCALLLVVTTSATYALGPLIMAQFTSDPSIVALSLPLLAICMVWQPMRSIGLCAATSLNVVGEARAVGLMAVFGMWVLAAGGAYVLGIQLGLGLTGLFLALIADEIVRASFYVLRWRRQKPGLRVGEASAASTRGI
ncbi:MATE family efflux transporter [Paenibacillus puerhi]|uniref:MATE family efflux transporter n=1 Tax=Paenibacillus puerhi TaxID=2692622 RepID=UPI0013584C8E|nr:MATE family efflux transporter [Paenibacillus puerhi]